LNGLRRYRVQRCNSAPLCIQPDMAVMLEHLAAEMAAACLDSRIGSLCLRQRRNEVMA